MSSAWSDDLVPSQVPAPPSGGSRPPTIVAVVVLILLLGIAAIPTGSFVRGARGFWPADWDARLAPIAQRDEALRGLTYKHPVAVRFLSDKAFVKLLERDRAPSASDRADIARTSGTFRALGFVGGKVDLQKAATDVQDAGTIAFYDPLRKEVVVRGTTIDVSHRATLAHELTHVLQDQYFDLRAIQRRAARDDERSGGSSTAIDALIEGDANHVMDRYVKALSPADRKAYQREQAAQSKSIGKASADIPPFVSLLFGAPYEFGPQTIRVLFAKGGNSAVDAALTGPTPTSAMFVQTGLVAASPDLAAPALIAGEKADGKPESFGPLELYLTLAVRLDPRQALAAADAVEGGRARGLRKAGTYCYRATVATRDAEASTFVARLARLWAASATRGSVSRSGTAVTITACDPGTKTPAPANARIRAAEELLAVRGSFTAEVAENNVPADAARCVARLYASRAGGLAELELDKASAAQQRAIVAHVQASALECRDDPEAGLR